MSRFLVESVAVAVLAVAVGMGALAGGAVVEGMVELVAITTWLGLATSAWRAGRRAEVAEARAVEAEARALDLVDMATETLLLIDVRGRRAEPFR